MFDTTAKLILHRLQESWSNMADHLAEFVYTDESKEVVDVINLLLLGWIILGIIVYIVGTTVASQFRKKKTETTCVSEKPTDGDLLLTAGHDDSKVSTTNESSSADGSLVITSEEVTDEIFKSFEVSVPVASGNHPEVVEWLNDTFAWIYGEPVTAPIVDAFIVALNCRTRIAATEHGIQVEFKELKANCPPPILTNVYTNVDNRGNAVIASHIVAQRIIFKINVTQVKEKELHSVPYELIIERLEGKIGASTDPEKLTFTIRFLENPNIKLLLRPTSDTALPSTDRHALEEVVQEIISEAISAAIVDLNFKPYTDCPRLQRCIYDINQFQPDLLLHGGEDLLVKVIKASNLGGTNECMEPYCVVEMDEPGQRFQTGTGNSKNPFWDESHTFEVESSNAELLFELYDKGDKEKFLGLGIVSVEELLRNPSQRQIISLQSRPLENDEVSGSLTVEFLFLNREVNITEGTHLSPLIYASQDGTQPGKIIETNSRVTPGGTIITTTTIKRTAEEDLNELSTEE